MSDWSPFLMVILLSVFVLICTTQLDRIADSQARQAAALERMMKDVARIEARGELEHR